MSDLHCVELGFSPLKNLCRLTSSIVVPSKTPEDALRYVQTHCPEALRKFKVSRVYPVLHVVVDWPHDECQIIEVRSDKLVVDPCICSVVSALRASGAMAIRNPLLATKVLEQEKELLR